MSESKSSNSGLNGERTPRRSRASEAFFGRRHGKTLRSYQVDLLDDQLPPLLVNPTENFPGLSSLFPGDDGKPFNLEIGFGGGEHLNSERLRLRDENFLGVEPFVNGMAKMLAHFDEAPSDNLRLFNDDATLVLDWLPQGCVSRIDLLYPDPWPKKKHWKRRFVNQANLTRFARVLKPGGLFRFASDIDSYVNWTLDHIHQSGQFRWLAHQSSDWHEEWPHWVRTRYAAKAIREGRRPGYFQFERSPAI